MGQVCLFENFLTETLLPKGIMRKLSEEEMKEYAAPFKNEGEDRRPTLFLPREIPIEGHPKVSLFIVSLPTNIMCFPLLDILMVTPADLRPVN